MLALWGITSMMIEANLRQNLNSQILSITFMLSFAQFFNDSHCDCGNTLVCSKTVPIVRGLLPNTIDTAL